MTWEYRVLEYDDAEAGVTIHEITYDRQGRIFGWSGSEGEPIRLVGYDLADLRGNVELLRAALDKPVLRVRDVVVACAEARKRDARGECSDCGEIHFDDACASDE